MSNGKFDFIRIVEIQSLCERIKKYYKISYNEAIKQLYNSKLYSSLEDEETKMWYFSTFDLFNMFKDEKETGKYTVYGG